MNEIYFSKKTNENEAISSTAASSIKNRANELAKDLQLKIQGVSFLDETINIIGSNSDEGIPSKYGIKADKLQEVIDMIEKRGDLNALNAWICKATETKFGEIDRLSKVYSYNSWYEDIAKNSPNFKELTDKVEAEKNQAPLLSRQEFLEKELKERNTEEPKMPAKPELIQKPIGDKQDWEIDYLNLSIAEMAEFLSAVSKAAVYGNLIHHEGDILKKAKDEAMERKTSPVQIVGEGSQTIIHRYKLSIPDTEIEAFFDKLHAKHREYEKIVNSFRYKAKAYIDDFNTKAQAKYSQEMEDYKKEMAEYDGVCSEILKNYDKIRDERKLIVKESTIAQAQLTNEFNKWKIEETSKVSRLKHIIPNRFKNLCDSIDSQISSTEN